MGGQLLEKNQLFPLKKKKSLVHLRLNLVDFRKAAISPSSLINHWIDQQRQKARFLYSFGFGNWSELSSYLPSDIAFQQATFLLLPPPPPEFGGKKNNFPSLPPTQQAVGMVVGLPLREFWRKLERHTDNEFPSFFFVVHRKFHGRKRRSAAYYQRERGKKTLAVAAKMMN